MKQINIILILAMLVFSFNWCSIGNAADEKQDVLTILVYPVGDLVTKIKDYPYQGGEFPTSGPLNSPKKSGGSVPFISPAVSGGGFGGGGGGGGFSVQDPVGEGQFQIASGVMQGNANQQGTQNQLTPLNILKTIMASIEPASWEDNGGTATGTVLGSMLLIRQTKNNHKNIQELLEQIRSNSSSQKIVHITAYWVCSNHKLNMIGLNSKQAFPIQLEDSVMENILVDKDGKASQGILSQITCFNGQTVCMTSGKRKALLQGLTPTVGVKSMAYQPRMVNLHSGVILQVKPQLDPNGKSVSVDIQSVITKLDDSQKKPQDVRTIFSDTKGKNFSLDDINMDVQELSTTVRIPTGKFVLIGGMTPSKDVIAGESTVGDSCSLIIRVQKIEANKSSTISDKKTP
jgi:Bacterial type II and III secretion system protein